MNLVTEDKPVSVAFTKEDSAETAAETQLPDRPVSSEPNLVTRTGFLALQQQLEAARAAYEAAMTEDDINERRRQSAIPLRDLRYFAERLRSAQLVPDAAPKGVVVFGSTVRLKRDDGRVQTYRIVGEDEADPKAGTISHVSPMARSLLGRQAGDEVSVAERELEIIAIS